MYEVSYLLFERFSQDPLETYFCKQHSPRAWNDNLPFYDFGYANTFWNQTVFKLIATGSVWDENIKFESDRTKQSLQSLKLSSKYEIPSYQTNTTSKLNKYINRYINKFTVPYFNSFCQSFHITLVYNILDHRLFCC